ncbi:alpha/beta hydrolase family protein [Amycolatopsis xylanica]|nr:tannase/feruloyl esterase family alpha/beta hydrolase [Amycolatopsis xylanica]
MRTLLAIAVLAATVIVPAAPAPAASCGTPRVPGAEHQESAHVADLSTAGGHTDPADWAGLTPASLPAPAAVPGIQIDGYFPDTSTGNTNHGWNHDSQFVLRMPDRWNGGLVVSGAPGVREQYANDRAISDWVLAKGYAFASTDKGNTGATFYTDGRRPGDALAEWNFRVTQLTLAAKAAVAHRYCGPVRRTIATGLSNGGYLVRWQLENHPELFDGGVDWEGTLWTDRTNLLTFLPPALRAYPDADAMHAAGFPAGSEFLWDYHHKYYWDLTQRIYRTEFDPAYTGAEADYDYASRPASVHRAVERISLTGRIGKPLLTLHGTLDVLLPISLDSDVYARMVHDAGRDRLFRYYRVEGGNHVDGLFEAFPDSVRPLTPCHRSAFTALESWLGAHVPPPASRTIPREGDVLTTCHL